MKYRGKMITRNLRLSGFALPTVMIASLVMFIVLLAAVSATVAIRTSLNDQYYNKLAQSAADAGAAYAKACLAGNEGKQTWTAKLITGTPCNGVRNNAFCATGSSCNYVYTDNQYIRTSFEVECTGTSCAQNVKPDSLKISGRVELLRGGLGVEVWRNYSQVSRLTRFIMTNQQVAMGASHTCALAFNSRLYCWGSYGYGQLGYSNVGNQYLTPMDIGSFGGLYSKTTKFVAAGTTHTCSLDSAGQAYCWGNNSGGQLGMGSKYYGGTTSSPEAISSALVFTYLSAGDFHSCGVSSGQAYCWGRDSYGQIGNSATNDVDDNKVPTAVATGVISGSITAITSGHGHNCAITNRAAGNNIFCWGENNYGQLGINTRDLSADHSGGAYTPVALNGSMNYSAITRGSGNGYHTCAISSGKIYCWGWNGYGQLGDSTTGWKYVPTPVTSSSVGDALYSKTIKAVTSGDYHTCALDTAGVVYCWGRNSKGQLGNGDSTHTQQNAPVRVNANVGDVLYGKTIVSIGAGSTNTCAIDIDGYSYCWGSNSVGQFGDGTIVDSDVPVKTTVPPTIDYYY